MDNFRQGVYTSFTVNSIFSSYSNKKIGVVAVTNKSDVVNQVFTINSLAKAKELFGEVSIDNEIMVLLNSIFIQTTATVQVVAISKNSTQNYNNALDLILNTDAYILCFGNIDDDFLPYLKEKLNLSESNSLEKIAVISSSDYDDAITKSEVNDKRILVAFPKITINNLDINVSQGVLAGMICNLDEASSNLNGLDILTDYTLTQTFDDEKISSLIENGVCVFENISSITTLIRAVTTKTLDDNQDKEYTYKNLSTILIIDTVIPDIRNILKEKLLNSSNNTATINSVKSLIITKLDLYKELNYISSYRNPTIYLSKDDESVCVVELDFTIVQGVYQVYLNVQVSV